MKRSFKYYPGQFDCGCIQSDSITVEKVKTLQLYMKIADKNEQILELEADWCRRNSVTAIVSDIVPFAFSVGFKAKIPTVAVSNFTWYDIYKPYISILPEFQPYFDIMKKQYEKANLVLALIPSSPMRCFPNQISMPVVGRRGVRRKGELFELLNSSHSKKLGLIYTGNFGMDSIPWEKLERFGAWNFVGLHPIPGNPCNYYIVNNNQFPFTDLFASVDLIIGKIGYGIYSECLAHGIPLLYVPRSDFVEHEVLEKAIKEWGYGFSLSHEDYYSLRFDDVLLKIAAIEKPVKHTLSGAEKCANKIESFMRSEISRS
jgi:L-arabinokinase